MKEKAAERKQNADRRPRAVARYQRISARKAKIVLDLVRGKSVNEALAILAFTPKAACPMVEKLLNSAVANAENNLDLDRNNLYVAEAFANQGAIMKRFRIVSRSMVHPYVHRLSHITVVLDQIEK
jgi:large subunit ribosomal protein L22